MEDLAIFLMEVILLSLLLVLLRCSELNFFPPLSLMNEPDAMEASEARLQGSECWLCFADQDGVPYK